ncbi:MAG: hypothetical protein A3F78_16560 [Burkholderiales bacterium RIFCSPLOWO2_12_FULL_61_40]|nr:MAG: hypothetical protein A3F78_16560 [Burkholderiales bacterium RIFCSPLOWO2_12_FULL_61_40]
MAFMERLRQSQLNVDIFGRGIRFIGDKWDGLAPYRYALAIENSSSRDYWTEKVADCFLAWTVPIYYGCTNLEDYFPPGAFVRIDINEPDKAIEIISSLMSDDDWRRRLPALNEARQLVLDRYQFFPLMCDLVDRHYENEPTAILALRKYQDSFALIKRVKRRMLRFVENLKP